MIGSTLATGVVMLILPSADNATGVGGKANEEEVDGCFVVVNHEVANEGRLLTSCEHQAFHFPCSTVLPFSVSSTTTKRFCIAPEWTSS
jgi:hypothetical protein